MEIERVWEATEEEEVEELGTSLEIRQKRKGKMGIENEGKVVKGGENSVYLDEDNGVWKCRHCTWTYHLWGPAIDPIQKHQENCQVGVMDVEKLTQLRTYIDSPTKGGEVKDVTFGLNSIEVNHFIAEENLQNGKSYNGTKEFLDHKDVSIRNSVTENGSNLHQSSGSDNGIKEFLDHKDVSIGNSVTENGSNLHRSSGSDNGTKEFLDHKDVSIGNSVTENGSNSHQSSGDKYQTEVTKLENEIEESDQLKPEQLYVPEFVERVVEEQDTHDLFCPNCHSCITKRVILRRKRKRVVREPRESQPELPPEKIQHVEGQEGRSTPTEILDHEDETVFTCFSCFTYFIPADGGFKIFPIFGKKRDGSKDLQSSEKMASRNVSWFSTLFGANSSKNESTQAGVPLLSEVSGDQSSREESSPPLSMSAATGVGQNGAAIGVNNADPSTGESYAIGGLVGNQAQGNEQDISEDSSAEKIYGNGGLNGNYAYPAAPVSELKDTSKPNFSGQPPILEGISQIDLNIINPVLPSSFLPQDIGKIFDKSPSLVKPASTTMGTTSEIDQNIQSPAPTVPVDVHIEVRVGVEDSGRDRGWDILKSVVYGGLIESITSLSVVSSAAGAGSSTLNICALGLANLIGGLVVIAHNLSDLKSTHDAEATDQRNKRTGRYWEQLGKREHFLRHVVFSILSYIIFGLLPPVVYGFTFRKSDNKEHKLIAVATSSLLCVALLAIGKAHVKIQRDYIKSLFYYLALAIPASGLSYVAGVMINRLLVELGVFDQSSVSPSPPSSIELFKFFGSETPTWASL